MTTYLKTHMAGWLYFLLLLHLILLPQVMAILPVPLCAIYRATLRVFPCAQPFAIDIFIDLSETNWEQGPLTFGHRFMNGSSISTSLQQEARGLTVDSPLNILPLYATMLGMKLLQKSLGEYSIYKPQQGWTPVVMCFRICFSGDRHEGNNIMG